MPDRVVFLAYCFLNPQAKIQGLPNIADLGEKLLIHFGSTSVELFSCLVKLCSMVGCLAGVKPNTSTILYFSDDIVKI